MDTNTIIWIVQILGAIIFFMAGIMKVMKSKAEIAETGERMAWVEDFSPNTIKIIGALELAGGLGLVFPWLLNILPILTPLAGVGLVLTMVGAAVTHLKRQEYSAIVPNMVLLAMVAFVAYGRFVLVPIAG